MIVVDASVLATMLAYTDQRGRKARATLSRDTRWAAPEHWKAEVFSAIRGLALGGQITDERATWALDRMPKLGMDHVSLDVLLSRMWRMRETISGYDAAYVALAAQRELTLLTSDQLTLLVPFAGGQSQATHPPRAGSKSASAYCGDPVAEAPTPAANGCAHFGWNSGQSA